MAGENKVRTTWNFLVFGYSILCTPASIIYPESLTDAIISTENVLLTCAFPSGT
jgi:hypothetical protein